MAPKDKHDSDQRARRARADHAAMAIEALHAAIEHLSRASYHLAATEIATPSMTHVATANDCAAKAHALARILADRLP